MKTRNGGPPVKVKNFKLSPEFYDLQVDWDKRLKKEKAGKLYFFNQLIGDR